MTNWQEENDQRLVRAGYYRKHKRQLNDNHLLKMNEGQKQHYKSYYAKSLKREQLLEKLGYGVLGVAAVGFIGFSILQSDSSSSSNLSETSNYIKGSTYNSSDYTPSYESSFEEDYAEDEDCNPNYSGCVDNSSYDLDCPDIGYEVEVIGDDEYGLDRDNDGYGCESY